MDHDGVADLVPAAPVPVVNSAECIGLSASIVTTSNIGKFFSLSLPRWISFIDVPVGLLATSIYNGSRETPCDARPPTLVHSAMSTYQNFRVLETNMVTRKMRRWLSRDLLSQRRKSSREGFRVRHFLCRGFRSIAAALLPRRDRPCTEAMQGTPKCARVPPPRPKTERPTTMRPLLLFRTRHLVVRFAT